MKKKAKKNRSSRIVACCHDPSREQVFRAAEAYLASGLSLIPIRADGTKMPAFERLPKRWCAKTRRDKRGWAVYREHQPTIAELERWFLDDWYRNECGMAILGGAVSGNLEIIDLDNWGVVEPWQQLVEKQAPGLLEKLVRVRTPRPGMHCYYRCEIIGGSDKLARVPEKDEATGKMKPKTIIETKGEGGYCLAPPSPAACHPRGKCYLFLGGKDLTMVPTISPKQREILLEAARSLNTWKEPERPMRYRTHSAASQARSGQPGDDFNARADWASILEPHGWRCVGASADECEQWQRPGATHTMSANVNYGGFGLLFVFSTNASPFEVEKWYTKFHAYALLNHDGDFSAAAGALARLGYGRRTNSAGRRGRSRIDPRFSRYADYQVHSPRR
jgi:putative DNA primase/helicase